MRLPTWEELEDVEEQLDVLERRLDKPLFVAGPPGSGKTVLALRRAQMVAGSQPKTVVLTYNRMLRRLMALLCEQSGITAEEKPAAFGGQVATAQSYVWHHYVQRAHSKPPTHPYDDYAYNWDWMLHTLEEREVGPNVCHLVVDEGQDLAPEFFTYASRHISRILSVFADENQAINQHTTLREIQRAANLPDPILLTENHRNTPQIARLAEHFHGGGSGELPVAAVQRSHAGEVPRLIEVPRLEDIAARIGTYQTNQGGSTGAIVDQNSTGEDLAQMLRQSLPGVRIDIYTNHRSNEDGINVLEDGVTVLNKESVKGQEFDAVFVLELHRFLPCSNESRRRGMYMMCSRARDDLWLICGPGGQLTPEIGHDLPGPDILRRQ